MAVAGGPDVLGHRMISAGIMRLCMGWDGCGLVILWVCYLDLVFITGRQMGFITGNLGVSCILSGLKVHFVEGNSGHLGQRNR